MSRVPRYVKVFENERDKKEFGFQMALESAMTYCVMQDAYLTAYSVINSLKVGSKPATLKSLSIFAPRQSVKDEFVNSLADYIHHHLLGYDSFEIYVKDVSTTGVTYLYFQDKVLVSVSAFPESLNALLADSKLALEDVTWSVPVTCSKATWYPKQLLPEVMNDIFTEQSSDKMVGALNLAIRDRREACASMPSPSTSESYAALHKRVQPEQIAVPVEPHHHLPLPTPQRAVSCWPGISMYMWTAMDDFAGWLIQFEEIPYDNFVFPPGSMDIAALSYLQYTARQQYILYPYNSPLENYIYASKMTAVNRAGFWSLLLLPLLQERTNFRDQIFGPLVMPKPR